MPVDSDIALQAGKTTNPFGAAAAQPNFLANPAALNQLLQMGSNIAAGRAVQGAIGPNGMDVNQALQNLSRDPRAAYGALQAVGQIQSAANAQQARAKAQNDALKSGLAGLLAMGNNLDKGSIEHAIKDLGKRGLITPQLEATALSNIPVNPLNTKELDQPRAMGMLTQMLLQQLEGDQQRAALNGQPVTQDVGNEFITYMLPITPGVVNPTVVRTPKTLSPGEAIGIADTGIKKEPITGLPVPTQAPGAVRAGEVGVPTTSTGPSMTTGPLQTGPVTQGAVTKPQAAKPSVGSGRIPAPAAKILAARPKGREAMMEAYNKLTPEDKKVVDEYFGKAK